MSSSRMARSGRVTRADFMWDEDIAPRLERACETRDTILVRSMRDIRVATVQFQHAAGDKAYNFGRVRMTGPPLPPPPPPPPPVTVTFTSIATGDFHTCGLATTHAAYCWGDNTSGQLAGGSIQPFASSPVA